MENKSNSLAKISLGINVLLVIAVIVLFVKMPSSGTTEEVSDVDTANTEDLTMLGDKGENAVVVYYNSDTLNKKSLFIKELQKEIQQVQIDAENKMRRKEDEIRKWERKWTDKQPLLSSEQEQYMQEAQQKQNELMMFQQNLEQELMQKQTELTIAGINRISLFGKKLALKNGYDFIWQYSIGQNIVYCNPKMDVTDELVEMMNADYNGESVNEVVEEVLEENTEEGAE